LSRLILNDLLFGKIRSIPELVFVHVVIGVANNSFYLVESASEQHVEVARVEHSRPEGDHWRKLADAAQESDERHSQEHCHNAHQELPLLFT